MKKNRSEELGARLLGHRSKPSRQKSLKSKVKEGTDLLLKRHFAKYHDEMMKVCGDITKYPMFDDRKVRRAISFVTDSPTLNIVMGGGIPSGVTEIYGEESVGKTTLLASLIGSAQSQGLEVALCMSEFFDKPRFAKLGVCLDELLFLKGRGEPVLELAAAFISGGASRALFIDSMTSFRPDDDEFDSWAYMVLGWLNHALPRVSTRSSIVMTNQVRARRSKDPSKVFSGGVSSTAKRVAGMFDARLELSRESVTETTYDLVVNVVSNVLARPSRFVTLPVIKDKGIDVWRDLIRVASVTGALTKNGTWYYLGPHRLGQGEEAAARALEGDPEMTQHILKVTSARVSA